MIPVLFTFYIQDVLKLKKNNSGAKRLRSACSLFMFVTALQDVALYLQFKPRQLMAREDSQPALINERWLNAGPRVENFEQWMHLLNTGLPLYRLKRCYFFDIRHHIRLSVVLKTSMILIFVILTDTKCDNFFYLNLN